jgi:hypothetical protein
MHCHPLKSQKNLTSDKFSCAACSQEKLAIKPVTPPQPTYLKQDRGCRPVQRTKGFYNKITNKIT